LVYFSPHRLLPLVSIEFVPGLGCQRRSFDAAERSPTGRDIIAGLTITERNALQSPKPGAVDFITGEVASVPTISPFRYPLGCQKWLKLLKTNKVCSFTGRRLTNPTRLCRTDGREK
jgi:hypothetical protein